jgi:hypothetical protein
LSEWRFGTSRVAFAPLQLVGVDVSLVQGWAGVDEHEAQHAGEVVQETVEARTGHFLLRPLDNA